LIGLGVLGLALLALWAYSRNRDHATACGEKTVTFEQHSATLSPDGKSALRELAACLKANPTQTVRLEGRADNGEKSYNAALPRGRAEALVVELRALGVPASQVTVFTNEAPCAKSGETCRSASATSSANSQP